ncbi:MAG: hypothetical protein J6S49_07430 [Erysipelotrichaceae bacterium]|nr:hypothetical protein [Erysipelotrichaceae bacterium]
MNVIEELVHYCKEPDPIGALLLTGEWGSGKTYLIENDLTEALGADYAVVRISLFGVSSISELQQMIRRKWLAICFPFINRIQRDKELVNRNSGFMSAVNSIIRSINPIAGRTVDIVSSMNIVDVINIEPEYEDFITHKKKKVILVFDDLERCKADIVEVLGTINECCENRHFNTIVITNLKYLMMSLRKDLTVFNMLKEKTISHTILYQPDFRSIIHRIITERKWRSDEYLQYLLDNEELICDIFDSPMAKSRSKHTYEKAHNLLTLISSLQSFHRIYYHLKNAGVENISDFMTSYIPYLLCKSNGIVIDGTHIFEFSDDDIQRIYPCYVKERLFPCVRTWITSGSFDENRFYEELEQYQKKQSENDHKSKPRKKP